MAYEMPRRPASVAPGGLDKNRGASGRNNDPTILLAASAAVRAAGNRHL
jgi:hypothetical protein